MASQCRPSLPHHTLTSTTANMSYPVSLNLVDVRQVFEGRSTEWESEGLPSFSMNRGQAIAHPRLQQLQSNVAGWQGKASRHVQFGVTHVLCTACVADGVYFVVAD